MQQWEKISDKPIDIVHWIPLFTLDVLGVTVLSRNFNAMKGEESADLEAVNIIIGNSNKPKALLLGMVSSGNIRLHRLIDLMSISWRKN
jgi:hypothetical protein